jgi:hypothetical protein
MVRRKTYKRKVCFWVKKRRTTKKRKTRKTPQSPKRSRPLREDELAVLNSAFPNKPRIYKSLLNRPLTYREAKFLDNYNFGLSQKIGGVTNFGGVTKIGGVTYPKPAIPPMSLPVYGPRPYNEDDDSSSSSSPISTLTSSSIDPLESIRSII